MDLKMTDPAHRERFVHLAPDEVVNEPGQQPDAEQRHTAILATLIGCGGIDTFREMLLGNDRHFLTRVVSRCLPYIGPPAV